MEEFEKWLNEQKKNPAWETLGIESQLYQAWVSGAMNQAAQQSVKATLLESEQIFDDDGEVIGTRSVPLKTQSG